VRKKIILTVAFLISSLVLSPSSASANPLVLAAGDSVTTASNPNNVLSNPLTNAVLIEVTSSNNSLMTCGNVIGATTTAIDLGAATGGTTVGAKIQTEASRAAAASFVYDPSSTYSTWCVGPTVSPYYFSSVRGIQLTFRGGVTAWALTVGPNSFVIAGQSTGSTPTLTAAQIAAFEAALAKAADVAKAKAVLTTLIAGNKPANVQEFANADYKVRNSNVAEKVSAAMMKLSVADRENTQKVNEIINLEDFLDRISVADTRSTVKSRELTSRGLLPATSLYKHSVVQGLASYPSGSLDSMAKIDAAIKEQIFKAEAPKRRLAEIKAKIAARNK
jgi:rRNA maturation endonuclease Nob1